MPIEMPLIAGSSAISMVILFAEEHPFGVVSSAILISSALSALLLCASPRLFEFLGRRGAMAFERLMGMLLIMIAVQMILDRIDAYLAMRG